jgi:cytochrome c-type biogenesis protein CcmH/NrfG
VGGGASGAIFGVAGGVIVAVLLTRRGPGNELLLGRVLPSLLLFVLYNLVVGFRSEEIDNVAHLGGLVVGAAFGAARFLWPGTSLVRVAAAFVIALCGGAYVGRHVRAPIVAEFAPTPQPHAAALPDVGAEIARLEHLVTRRPDSIALYSELGTAYMEARRFEDAIDLLTRARGKRPDDVAVLTALGTAYLNLHHFDDAVEAFERIARLDSSNPEARYNLADAYLLRGLALVDSGRTPQARADFDRVVRLDSGSELAQEARRQIRSLAPHSTKRAS